MADKVAMDDATVTQAATDTATAHGDVFDDLNSVVNIATDLSAGWTGDASVRFGEIMDILEAEGKDILDELEKIANNLDSSAAAAVFAEEDSLQELTQHEYDI